MASREFGRDRTHSVEDDERLARRLQQEEDDRHRGLQDSRERNQKQTDQELRDLELARQFARMDMHHQSSMSTRTEEVQRAHFRTSSTKNASRYEDSHRNRSSERESLSPEQRIQATPSVEAMLANARKLQEKAFTELTSGQHQDVPLTEYADLEFARRLQSMENAEASHPVKTSSARYVAGEETGDLSERSYQADDLLREAPRHSVIESSTNKEDRRLRDMSRGEIEKCVAFERGSSTTGKQTSQDEILARFLEESGRSMDEISSHEIDELMYSSRRKVDAKKYGENGKSDGKKDPRLPSSEDAIPFSSMDSVATAFTSFSDNVTSKPISSDLGHLQRLPTSRSLSPSLEISQALEDDFQEAKDMSLRGVTGPTPTSLKMAQSSGVSAMRVKKKKKKFGFLGFGSRNTQSSAKGAPPASIPPAPPLPDGIPPPSVDKAVDPTPRSQRPGASIRGSFACYSCGKMGGSFIQALGKRYHPDCFRCTTCYEVIDAALPFAFSVDGNGTKRAHHPSCRPQSRGIQCVVCKHDIRPNNDGTIPYVAHPFFEKEQMCMWHTRESIRRCTSCHRFEAKDNPFVDLDDDDRCVCFACCRTVIMDNVHVKPIWERVLSFYENHLGLPIWEEMVSIPVIVVDSATLAAQLHENSSMHECSNNIMTRGLCVTNHHALRPFRTPSMRFNRSSSSFEAKDKDSGFTYMEVSEPATRVSRPRSSEVCAVLCLSGLPKELTASVLAHEALHVWIKLHPDFHVNHQLSANIEEGCAQLAAHLYLTDGSEVPSPLQPNDAGPSDEKLLQYFRFCIETEKDEVYGGGYRAAAKAYSDMGMARLLNYVLQYNEFPTTT